MHSALVADMVPVEQAHCVRSLRIMPRSRRSFWDALAARDPRWLRQRGWPISIAGRTAGDFPGGTIAYDTAGQRALITIDPPVSSVDFLRELAAHFGFDRTRTVICLTWPTQMVHVAPPKPWY